MLSWFSRSFLKHEDVHRSFERWMRDLRTTNGQSSDSASLTGGARRVPQRLDFT